MSADRPLPRHSGSLGTSDLVHYYGAMMQENSPLTAVRMFPDYADTVLWLDGPVDYEDSGLSSDLVLRLYEWEQSYYDSLDSNFEWTSPGTARAFTAVGIDLAGRVANELGAEFSIEFHSYGDTALTYSVRSHAPAANERASAAFSRIGAEMEAEEERAARLVAESGPNAEWTAFAPLSGKVFTPGDQSGRTDSGP